MVSVPPALVGAVWIVAAAPNYLSAVFGRGTWSNACCQAVDVVNDELVAVFVVND